MQISDTPRRGFATGQNLSSGFADWICEVWWPLHLVTYQFRQNFKTTETFMWKELNEAVDSQKRIEDSFKDSPWSFSQNIVNGRNPLTTFAKKFPSEMFERVLNILLVTACLFPLKIYYCHQLTKNDRKKIVKEISIKIIKSNC